jgi:hypothetical protein
VDDTTDAQSDTRNIKRSHQDDLAAHGVKLSHVTVRKIIAGREDRRMSKTLDGMNNEHIDAFIKRHTIQRRSEPDTADMAEAIRHGSKPDPLSDVPLHKRGFGVMDEDVP